MTRVVVADTGPLIALARVDKLDLLRRLYGRVVVPPVVRVELALDSPYPGASVISAAFTQRWIVVQPAPDPVVAAELAGLLDPGEAQAISFAEQQTTRFLLIDDAKGRKIARRRGIRKQDITRHWD
jgi:predicted nucleic acid-binding protein